MMRFLPALFLSALAPVAAAVPMQLTHSARVLDASGAPVSGPVAVAVGLYAADAGGAPLWDDAWDVTATDGYVSVVLGAQKLLDSPVFDRGELWLELSVGGDAVGPRTRLVAVPYAARADVAERVDVETGDPAEGCASGAVVYDARVGGLRVCVAGAWQLLRAVPMPGGAYGSGLDGDLVVATAFNPTTDARGGRSVPDGVAYRVLANPTSTVLSTTGSAGFAPGDLALLINLQGAAGSSGSVGNWELVQVTGTGVGSIHLAGPPQQVYDSGSFSTQKVAIQRVPQYGALTIASGGSVVPSPWNDLADLGGGRVATGIVALAASTSLTVQSGGTIDASAAGYRGGASPTYTGPVRQGEWITGDGAASTARSGGGGGGGSHSLGQFSGGGGGGGYGAAGEGGFCDFSGGCGQAGATYGAAALEQVFLGAGGGGGSENCNGCDNDGRGGHGGGAVLVFAESLVVQGTVRANGEGGRGLNTASKDGGGGGSGGSVYVRAATASLGTGLVSASGGARSPGAAGGGSSAGGAGGAGRIAVFYADALAGSTTPAAYSAQE